LEIAGALFGFRSPGCAGSAVERLHERDQSLAFQRQDEVSERRSLKLRGKKWPVAVEFSVNYQCPAGREWERNTLGYILKRFGGDHGYGRQVSIHGARCICDCCREQNVVSESKQCLREPFEQRDISADENHFCHYGISLTQPGVEPIPDSPR
jgi:hypothetical protein